MSNVNWKGQPIHVVDQWWLFHTEDRDRARMIELYDYLVNKLGDDEAAKGALNDLIDAARMEQMRESDFDCEARMSC